MDDVQTDDVQADDVDRAMAQWHRERPDIDTAPMAIIGRLARLEAGARAAIEGPLRAHGLLRGDFDVLATLRRTGEPYACSPSSLAEQLLITRAGLTGRVDRLERAGWVSRTASETDGRGKAVTLTAGGRELIDGLLADHVDRERALLAPLTPDEQRTLDGYLRRLLADGH